MKCMDVPVRSWRNHATGYVYVESLLGIRGCGSDRKRAEVGFLKEFKRRYPGTFANLVEDSVPTSQGHLQTLFGPSVGELSPDEVWEPEWNHDH